MVDQQSRVDAALAAVATAQGAAADVLGRLEAVQEEHMDTVLPDAVILDINQRFLRLFVARRAAEDAVEGVGELIGTGVGRQRLLGDLKFLAQDYLFAAGQWAPVAVQVSTGLLCARVQAQGGREEWGGRQGG